MVHAVCQNKLLYCVVNYEVNQTNPTNKKKQYDYASLVIMETNEDPNTYNYDAMNGNVQLCIP